MLSCKAPLDATTTGPTRRRLLPAGGRCSASGEQRGKGRGKGREHASLLRWIMSHDASPRSSSSSLPSVFSLRLKLMMAVAYRKTICASNKVADKAFGRVALHVMHALLCILLQESQGSCCLGLPHYSVRMSHVNITAREAPSYVTRCTSRRSGDDRSEARQDAVVVRGQRLHAHDPALHRLLPGRPQRPQAHQLHISWRPVRQAHQTPVDSGPACSAKGGDSDPYRASICVTYIELECSDPAPAVTLAIFLSEQAALLIAIMHDAGHGRVPAELHLMLLRGPSIALVFPS